jgi:ADP-ribose pyrophosphatase YjhB (NUDIX family)
MDNSHTTQTTTRRRALKVALYIAILGVLATVFTVRRVAAELSERGTSLGRSLESFAGLAGRVTALNFNGAAFTVSTKVLDLTLEQALERFVARCNEDTEQLTTELERELRPRTGLDASMLQRMLVLRDVLDDGTARSVCLGGLGEGGLSGLTDRVHAFAKSGDFSELGQLRYAFMRGVDKRTHVVLVSAQGSLKLSELFPTDGRDVQGPEVVPGVRPTGSTRILAAGAAGTPHVMNAYQVQAEPAAAMSDYGSKLEATGFKPTWIPAGHGTHYELSQDTTVARAYKRGDHVLVATSEPQPEGGSVLAVAQIDRPLPSAAGE